MSVWLEQRKLKSDSKIFKKSLPACLAGADDDLVEDADLAGAETDVGLAGAE